MLIVIVGKTNSGKDTVAKYLDKEYGFKPVVSYATRPKRDWETDGVEHWFITKEKMQELKDSGTIVAYTINDKTGIEYCTTQECFENGNLTYINNPNGIIGMRVSDFKTIYVYCSEENIISRGILRGDDESVLRKRLSSERSEFDDYYNAEKYDFMVSNDSSIDELLDGVDKVMQNLGYNKVGF